jgi:hypothetical protein
MTRSSARNMFSRVKTAFWSKLFGKKAESYTHKVKTPRSYYRAKAKQQEHSFLGFTPFMKRDIVASKSKKKR